MKNTQRLWTAGLCLAALWTSGGLHTATAQTRSAAEAKAEEKTFITVTIESSNEYVDFVFAGNEDANGQFEVDWGDGTVDQIEDIKTDTTDMWIPCTPAFHTYRTKGTYTIQLYPTDSKSTLRFLDVNYEDVSALDVSRNVNLTTLVCYANRLTSLDLSRNTALTELDCRSNQLTALDVSGCTALGYLACGNNQLTSLDVSGCTALGYLACDLNKLEGLDLLHNTALRALWCRANQLSVLDLSRNVNLLSLACDDNRLTSLDLSKNAALASCGCSENRLKSLDVSDHADLKYLDVSKNQLWRLDVSNDVALEELDCGNNRLTSLDVSDNVNLKRLVLKSNRLRELDVTACTQLEKLDAANNCFSPSAVQAVLAQPSDSAKDYSFTLQIDSLILAEGGSLDLSPWMAIDGTESRYVLYAYNPQYHTWTLPSPGDTSYTDQNGCFRFFKRGMRYQVRFTNNALRDYRKNSAAAAISFIWDIDVAGVANEGLAADEAASAPWAYAQGRTVYLMSDAPGEVEAFTAGGQRVYRGADRSFTVPCAGVYILRAADGRRCKVMVI